MTNLASSPETARQMAIYTKQLPHALLVTGPAGSGLTTTARHIASDSLYALIQPTDRDGRIDLSPKGAIRVKQIRELVMQASTVSKTRRVCIIDMADQMNTAAQNALLKLLEEPAPNTHFILTAHKPHQLLPTIRSRVQELRVEPLNREQSMALLSNLGVTDPRHSTQMLFLAEGLAAELTRLATDQSYFTAQSTAIRDAQVFLRGTFIEQYKLIESYQSDRGRSLLLLTAAERILRHSINSQPSTAVITAADRLATVYQRVAANGNIRLQLVAYIT